MNVLSLFDGISCGKVALDRAGVNVNSYFASEVDKDAELISESNHDSISRLGCVTKWREWDLPGIDVLIGGSPCQGFSFAGKQLNFNDERSALFFEFLNIKNYYKPEYFLLENVKMKKEYQDIISRLLGVEPIEINSKLVSGQNRVRLYWTNIPGVTLPEDKNIRLNDVLDSGWWSDREKSYCIDANYAKGTNFKRYFYRSSRQLVFRNDFQITKPGINEANELGLKEKGKWRKLSVVEVERLQNLPEGYTDGVKDAARYKALGNAWTVDVIAHIFKGLALKKEVGVAA